MGNSMFRAGKYYPCDPDYEILLCAQPRTSKVENVQYSTKLSQTNTE